jgi:hypothetical protein
VSRDDSRAKKEAQEEASAKGRKASQAVKYLLAGAIDYAGLFPPAALSMYDAARNYAEYLAGEDAWALGRFIVPIARLGELAGAASPFLEGASSRWHLSVLAGTSGADEWAVAERSRTSGATIESVELRASTTGEVRSAAVKLPRDVDVFYEIPLGGNLTELLSAIAAVGAKAKVRTGGVTAEAFPDAADLARFIVTCARAGVPFKATAGLHHPLRAEYRLTYAPDSPRAKMFGFLNLLLAAAFARGGLDEDGVATLLEERDADAFQFDRTGVTWRGCSISTAALTESRRALCCAFGSCSFTEPMTELRQLGLL